MPSLLDHWALALACSGAVYAFFRFVGEHLSKDAKTNLTLWLWGEYESTWLNQFCVAFDAIFGEKHFTLRCFARSCLASSLSVLILYFVFGPLLNLLSVRAEVNIELWQVLLLGALFNFLPDYISLLETRWLLKVFKRMRSFDEYVFILLMDLSFTATIISIPIVVYFWISPAEDSLIHSIAVFSITSVFFYSTFFTSLWAWLYCLTTMFVKLFSKTFLWRILDVENKPHHAIALVSAAIIFVLTFACSVLLQSKYDPDNEDSVVLSAFDRWVCSVFPSTCSRVVGSMSSGLTRTNLLFSGCIGGSPGACAQLGIGPMSAENKSQTMNNLKDSCETGNYKSCSSYGFILFTGWVGDGKQWDESHPYFERACNGSSDSHACYYLEQLNQSKEWDAEGLDVHQDGCEKGVMADCAWLGYLHLSGVGIEKDYTQAKLLYAKACAGDYLDACIHLAAMYTDGTAGEVDERKAFELIRKGCVDIEKNYCFSLANAYQNGIGTDINLSKAINIYEHYCDLSLDIHENDSASCFALGEIYLLPDRSNPAKALKYFSLGCDLGVARSCIYAAQMYERGEGVEIDLDMAKKRYFQGCTFIYGPGLHLESCQGYSKLVDDGT